MHNITNAKIGNKRKNESKIEYEVFFHFVNNYFTALHTFSCVKQPELKYTSDEIFKIIFYSVLLIPSRQL